MTTLLAQNLKSYFRLQKKIQMKNLFFLLLLLTLTISARGQKTTLTFPDGEFEVPEAFIKTYKGKVGKYPIVMKLTNWQDGTLSGSYYYTKVKKPINVHGDFTGNLTFEIEEMVKGEKTGTFIGAFKKNNGIISGVWKAPAGARELPFQVEEIVSPFDMHQWTGDWHLNGVWDHGTLIIGNVGKDSFELALQFFRSGHVGYLEGKARYNGTKAYYSQQDYDDEACELVLEKKEDSIELEQNSSNMACGFGMRAYAGGTYDSESKEVKATLAYGHEEDPFTTKKQHDAFLNLVGQDYYDLFAFNMQIHGKVDNKDPFEAKVVTGSVVGMMASNEAIIMTDRKRYIWAATIDFVGDSPVIRYFTNHPKYKEMPPRSIEEWRGTFPPHYRVIYEIIVAATLVAEEKNYHTFFRRLKSPLRE